MGRTEVIRDFTLTDTQTGPGDCRVCKGSGFIYLRGNVWRGRQGGQGQRIQAYDIPGGGGLTNETQPKEMWLTHYSPSLTRPDEYVDKARAIFARSKAARDGWSAELGFDED